MYWDSYPRIFFNKIFFCSGAQSSNNHDNYINYINPRYVFHYESSDEYETGIWGWYVDGN